MCLGDKLETYFPEYKMESYKLSNGIQYRLIGRGHSIGFIQTTESDDEMFARFLNAIEYMRTTK